MSGISYSHDVDLELHNQNPNCKNPQEAEEEIPPFSENFPSPFFYENQLFFGTMAADLTKETNLGPIWNEPLARVKVINMNTAQEISTNTSSTGIHLRSEPSDHSSKMKKSTSNKGSTARKSGKKDRHSKINTAQGVRDRRMRLSLHIARQFFDLQDMLGFDKASKTIDWLFSKSKKAIKQLNCRPSHLPQMNNNNICQNGSRGREISEQKRKVNIAASEGDGVSGLKTAKKSVTSGNTNYIAKELRDKARARARERARNKMMIRCLETSNNDFCDQAYNLPQLGPAEYPNLLFEIGQEWMSNSSTQDHTLTSQSSLPRQLANMALLGATASSSGSASSAMYNYDAKNGDFFTGHQLDSFCGSHCYTGNWDITSEHSNHNSINFHENPSYHFEYSDHNQVE